MDTSAETIVEKLDFRFAMDETDAADITKLVNEAYSTEWSVDNEYAFRSKYDKILAEEV